MEKAINTFNQWLADEMEILDDMAHEVATAETVDEMVKAKSSYEIQKAKTDAIWEAIRLVEETSEKEAV